MNFRLPIFDWGRKYDKKSSSRFPDFRSDNRKSKIENRKWAGIFAIALAFAFGGVVATAPR
jgi:hypothetical protein